MAVAAHCFDVIMLEEEVLLHHPLGAELFFAYSADPTFFGFELLVFSSMGEAVVEVFAYAGHLLRLIIAEFTLVDFELLEVVLLPNLNLNSI